MRISSEAQRRGGGFTLLEVVLSLATLALLSVSIFQIVGTTIGLAKTIVEEQEREIRFDDFEDYLGSALSGLRKESTFILEKESGDALQKLILVPSGLSYPYEGKDLVADETIFYGVRGQGGEIVFRQKNYIRTRQNGASKIEYPSQMTLMDGLGDFRWEVYDNSSRSWVSEWKNREGHPAMVRFFYRPADSAVYKSKAVWLRYGK